MGSIVLDTVNNFFATPRSHPDHDLFRDTAAAAAASSSTSSTTPPANSHVQRTPQQSQRRTPSTARRSSNHGAAEAPMSQRHNSGESSSSVARTATTPRDASSSMDISSPSPQSRTTTAATSASISNMPEPAIEPRASPSSPHRMRGNTAADDDTTRPAPARSRRIKVRDLQHIQSFAIDDARAFSEISHRNRSRSRGAQDDGPQYEISEMKVEHIIEMVAGLLTKITSTNDQQHEHLHRQPPSIDSAAGMSAQTSSVLAFHGKNIPSITILSYLSRINKYCPTSYEVFLSLLVYFDRMTERVNAGPIQGLREANDQAHNRSRASPTSSSSSSSLDSDKMQDIINTSMSQGAQTATPPASGSMERAAEQNIPGTPHSRSQDQDDAPSIPPTINLPEIYNLSHFFVVDSFNIHRLVIAGVTCASKFFSDIFYTNSRYAKVGGLPLPELNHLELQFLLLNDFRLSIPVEEIEAYGTMLVEFYAREVVAQQRAAEQMDARSLSESSADSAATVQAAG